MACEAGTMHTVAAENVAAHKYESILFICCSFSLERWHPDSVASFGMNSFRVEVVYRWRLHGFCRLLI
jgi:hypothetical protein